MSCCRRACVLGAVGEHVSLLAVACSQRILDVSVYQTPCAISCAAADMGKRGLQIKEEEYGEVMSPATPPLSHGLQDVRAEEEEGEVKFDEEDDSKQWHADWWQQGWCKDEWDDGHDDGQDHGFDNGQDHGFNNGQQWRRAKEEDLWNTGKGGRYGQDTSWRGRGSSRSSSSTSGGHYVKGGWVGPDQRFHPTADLKAIFSNGIVALSFGCGACCFWKPL